MAAPAYTECDPRTGFCDVPHSSVPMSTRRATNSKSVYRLGYPPSGRFSCRLRRGRAIARQQLAGEPAGSGERVCGFGQE